MATLLFAAACGDDNESAGSSDTTEVEVDSGGTSDVPNIWYVNPLPNTPDWGRSAEIFEAGGEEYGYGATVVGPNEIDVAAMVGMMEQAIADDADAIITCPLEPDAFTDVIAEAHNAGILVASIGCVDDNADFSVGTGNEEYGRLAADVIAQATNGDARVGILGTDQATPNQVEQVEGFRAQVEEQYAGQVEELVWESDDSDAGVAAQKISAMLAAFADLNYLWIIEGAAPGAVPSAFDEAGLQPGDVQVLAIDAQDSTLEAIEDGWITSTFNQCWFDASALIGDLLVQMVADDAEAESFYAVPVDEVTADDLPYEGCSAESVASVFER